MAATLPRVLIGLGKDLADGALATVDGLTSFKMRRVDLDYPNQDGMAFVQKMRQVVLTYVPPGAPPDAVIDFYNRLTEWVTLKVTYTAEGGAKVRKYNLMIQDVVQIQDGADVDTYQVLLVMDREELAAAIDGDI